MIGFEDGTVFVRVYSTLQRWRKPALTSCLISLSFVCIHHCERIIKRLVSHVAMEKDTRDPQPFEFRSPRGVRKIESHSRNWNGITVRNIVHYLDHGKVWHDISSRETTVAIVLEQIGGYAEPRLNLNRPTPRSRFDAGHATFVPADMPVWGYSDGIRSVRELRMSFPPALLGSILGDELDQAKIDKPVLMLYDDQITRCAALLADECREPLIGGRTYGENLTTAWTAALFTSRKAPTQRAFCARRSTQKSIREFQFSEGRSTLSTTRNVPGPLTGSSFKPICSCMAVKNDGPPGGSSARAVPPRCSTLPA